MHKGFVLLNCDLGAEEYVVEELNNIPEVTNAYVTFGAYDVVAIVNELSTPNKTLKQWYLTRLSYKPT